MADDRELSLHVVVAAYPNADGSNRLFAVRTCRPGDPIELRPELKHPLDEHAITVLNQVGKRLGYPDAAAFTQRACPTVLRSDTTHPTTDGYIQ